MHGAVEGRLTAIRACFNCIKLVLAGGAGHEVNVDAPEKLGKLLDKFFR